MKKHMIWGNRNLNLDDWRDDLLENYPELEGDESALYDLMYETNDSYLDDERVNLDIQLNAPIVVIGDLGLWDGRRMGYKLINSGNIKDCLYDNNDCVEWWVDERNNLRAISSHHDGTNYHLYRVFKENATATQRKNFLDKVYHGKVTSRDITRYTRRLGDYIGKVYGW